MITTLADCAMADEPGSAVLPTQVQLPFGFILILFTTFTYTLLKMCTYNAVFIIKVTTTYTAYINLNKSFVSSTVADRPCVAKGGKCQQNTLTCSGDYERGLCGGSSARQCCVLRSGKAIPPL